MNKIWILFKREYKAAVKTKSFIISLLLVPILMGGSLAVIFIMEDNQDTTDTHIVILDHSGLVEEILTEKAKLRNEHEIFNPETGEQFLPAYLLEFISPDLNNSFDQKLELSDKIRAKDVHAFIEIGKDVLHPGEGTEDDFIRYYSEHSFMDNTRDWISNSINNFLREQRGEALNLDKDVSRELMAWIRIEGMGLVDIDKKTGEQQEAEKTNEIQSFLVPYIILMLMFMLTMMSAIPLLTAVMEEKTERIAEVLLGSITPF